MCHSTTKIFACGHRVMTEEYPCEESPCPAKTHTFPPLRSDMKCPACQTPADIPLPPPDEDEDCLLNIASPQFSTIEWLFMIVTVPVWFILCSCFAIVYALTSSQTMPVQESMTSNLCPDSAHNTTQEPSTTAFSPIPSTTFDSEGTQSLLRPCLGLSHDTPTHRPVHHRMKRQASESDLRVFRTQLKASSNGPHEYEADAGDGSDEA